MGSLYILCKCFFLHLCLCLICLWFYSVCNLAMSLVCYHIPFTVLYVLLLPKLYVYLFVLIV